MGKTIVIFRKWPKSEGGDVIALFPTEPGTMDPYTCSSYEHIGQHGAADPVGLIQRTRPATLPEYTDLKAELERIGYNDLEVRHRLQSNYLEERRRALASYSVSSPTKRKTNKPKSTSRKSKQRIIDTSLRETRR